MALPDLIEIVPLTQPVKAEITVPGSKSITNRAMILSALADGEVTLKGALWSEDTEAMFHCLQKLGFEITQAPDPQEPCNRTITVKGLGGKIPKGGTAENPLELFVSNAGTAARFLAAFLCLGHGVYSLSGIPRMHERPQAALFVALRELGYRVESENGNDKLPVKIWGAGPKSGKCKVSIEKSSQFASALLLSAEIGKWQVEIVGENDDESPYVGMTREMVKQFSKAKSEYWVEPDASSSSYLKGAGWLFPNFEGPNLKTPSVRVPEPAWTTQIDRFFDDFFSISCSIRHIGDKSKNLVTISRSTHLGDSIMTAITLTPFSNQTINFTDLGRLRVQECERVVALRTELTKCGAKVVEEGDTLTVYPAKSEELHGAEIETYNDHRMAMCFAILGLKVPGIKLKNPACVKKTFPNFFQKLAAQPKDGGLGVTILDGKTGRKLTHEELFAD